MDSYNSKTTRMIENFKGKQNTNGLDANPENINRNGRPHSAIRKVNDAIIASGNQPASRSDIEQTYVLLAGLTEESLEKLRDDENNPILVRTVANALVTGWRGSGLFNLNHVLDRAIGGIKGGNDAPPQMIIDKANILVMLPQVNKEVE